MNVEEKIREALQRAPAAPETANSWATFERRARRATVSRAVSGVAVVALIAVASAAVVRLASDDPPAFDLGEVAGEYVDRFAGFAVDVPEGWEDAGAPGDGVKFAPAAQIPDDGTAAAMSLNDAIMVTIAPQQPRDYDEMVDEARRRFSADGISVRQDETFVGGRRAHRLEAIDVPRDAEATERCLCLAEQFVVDWRDRWVLTVSIFVGSADGLDRHGATARAVVTSVRPIAVASPVGPTGTFAPHVALTEHARALQRFLEARVAGEGAERYLTPEAQVRYRQDERHPNLYDVLVVYVDGQTSVDGSGGSTTARVDGSQEPTHMDIFGYRVLSAEAAQSGARTFEVELQYEQTPVGPSSSTERITIRLSDDDRFVIAGG